MKVFISWSGDKSRKVAELVDDWLQCTIQSCQPWLSSRSIDRGALWFSEITAELADTTIGIICLTKDNKDKPWILFESGALAKGLNSSRVCTFLIDLEPADLENPLAQFNHTIYTKASLQQLLSTINSLAEQPLKPSILEKVFEKYWPEFEEKFDLILSEEPQKPLNIKRNQTEMLAEILNTIRGLDRRMLRVESKPNNVSTDTNIINENRTRAKVAVMCDMLLSGQPFSVILEHAVQKWGYTNADAKILLDQATQRIDKSNAKRVNLVNNDMLEQLKSKFGK